MDLTWRQLRFLMKTIHSEKRKEQEFQAALLGRKLKPKPEPNHVSKKDRERMDKAAEALLQRMKEKHKKLKEKQENGQ